LVENSREKEMLGKFLREEGGATAIEYSLIAGFIALAIIAAVGMTGERLVALLEDLATALSH
jgi:pilus assembly protein Flp/PilA